MRTSLPLSLELPWPFQVSALSRTRNQGVCTRSSYPTQRKAPGLLLLLSLVWFRVLQDGCNDEGLILGGNRCVKGCRIKRQSNRSLTDIRSVVKQPLGKESGSQVWRGCLTNRRLGQPVFTSGMALCFPPRWDLRLVGDRFDASLLGSLGKDRGRR